MESVKQLITEDELSKLTSVTRGMYEAEKSLSKTVSDEEKIKHQKTVALSNYNLQREQLDSTQQALLTAYGDFSTIDLNTGEIIREDELNT